MSKEYFVNSQTKRVFSLCVQLSLHESTDGGGSDLQPFEFRLDTMDVNKLMDGEEYAFAELMHLAWRMSKKMECVAHVIFDKKESLT